MIKNYEWMIAWRYLRSKQKDSFISVISSFSLAGIAIGVATLIIVLSVMKGYEVDLIKRIVGINGNINISSNSGIMNYDAKYIQKIEKLPEVKFVAPMVAGQAMASYRDRSSGIVVRGLDVEDIIKKPMLSSSLKQGSFYKMNSNEVVIGDVLARRLKVRIGDKIKLISSSNDVTILGMLPKMKTFTVVGLFDVGMYEYNASMIFMPLEKAQQYFDCDEGITDIEIVLSHPDLVNKIKNNLASFSPNNLIISNFAQSNNQLIAALKVERNVMFIILTMIILVAAFNIISSLIMLVKDKTKSIAILMAMGMDQASILKVFIICGTLIGLIGSIIGTIIGVLVAVNIEKIRSFLEKLTGSTLFDPIIYYLTKLPSELEIYNVVMVLMTAIVLSFLATIYPAWRAAKMLPAQALRYE